MTTKPDIEFPVGPAPTELVITDLVVGGGDEAKPGDTVEVHYVGVEYDTGEEFDSSWNRGESIAFPLRRLIQGWQDGIPGMRVGGRRQLVIPPALAYGPAGSGHRLSGENTDLRHRSAGGQTALSATVGHDLGNCSGIAGTNAVRVIMLHRFVQVDRHILAEGTDDGVRRCG